MKTVLLIILASICSVISVTAQMTGISTSGIKIQGDDSQLNTHSSNSLSTNILYSGDGIVLYADEFPTSDEVVNDGACSSINSTSAYRCADFTVPSDIEYSLLKVGGWLFYDNCADATFNWNWNLKNAQGQVLSQPWYVASGLTYTYCLGVDINSVSPNCTGTSLCLSPFAIEVEYQNPVINPICQADMLQDLEDDCMNTVNTLHNDYACQYFCIADKTCDDYFFNGVTGWSDGFVNYIWTFFESRNDGPLYQPNNCDNSILVPDVIDEYLCFAKEGLLDHYFTEMAPAFFSYCKNDPLGSQNVSAWDENHDAFLENAVVPCFTDFIDMPEALSCTTARTTEFMARLLRELAQELCANSNTANQGMQDIITTFTNDFLGGNLCCLATGNIAGVCNDFDIVDVGASIVGSFIDFINPFGFNRNNLSDTLYFIDLDPEYYTVQNNQITITKSPSPFAKFSKIVNVFAYIPQDSTSSLVKQFMICDSDSDGDLLGDDYEASIGLDTTISNFGALDFDGDGIDDFLEAVVGSNPLVEDSDGDGFSDGIEFNTNTDYNNPSNFTSVNISVKQTLGNEYIEIHDFSQNQNQYIILGDFSRVNIRVMDFSNTVIETLDNQQSSIVIKLSNYAEPDLKLKIQHMDYPKLKFETIISKQ